MLIAYTCHTPSAIVHTPGNDAGVPSVLDKENKETFKDSFEEPSTNTHYDGSAIRNDKQTVFSKDFNKTNNIYVSPHLSIMHRSYVQNVGEQSNLINDHLAQSCYSQENNLPSPEAHLPHEQMPLEQQHLRLTRTEEAQEVTSCFQEHASHELSEGMDYEEMVEIFKPLIVYQHLQQTGAHITQDTASCFQEYISDEMSEEMEYCKMVELYKPLIVTNLIVREILPHLPFIEDHEDLYATEKTSPREAVIRLLDKLKSCEAVGKWQRFLEALELCGYEHIVDNIKGYLFVNHEYVYQRQHLRQLTGKLIKRIRANELLPRLYAEGLISHNDREEIQREYINSGNIAASTMLLSRIPRKLSNWYTIFIDVLRDENFPEIAEYLRLPFLVSSRNIEVQRDEGFPEIEVPIVPGENVDNTAIVEQCRPNERQAMDHVVQQNATLQTTASDFISSVTDSDDRFADKRFDAVCDTSNTHTFMIPRKNSRSVSSRKLESQQPRVRYSDVDKLFHKCHFPYSEAMLSADDYDIINDHLAQSCYSQENNLPSPDAYLPHEQMSLDKQHLRLKRTEDSQEVASCSQDHISHELSEGMDYEEMVEIFKLLIVYQHLQQTGAHITQDTASCFQEYISDEMSEEMEYCKMVELYKPLIVTNLIVREILPHLPFIEDHEDLYAIEKISQREAVIRLLDKLKSCEAVGKWQRFLEALELCGYEHIVDNIKGYLFVNHEYVYQRQHLRQLSGKLIKRIRANELLPRLYAEGLISHNDREEIQREYINSGNIAASTMLLSRIPRKLSNWYTIFIDVLRDENFPEIAEYLQLPFFVSSRKIEVKRDEGFPEIEVPIVPGENVDNIAIVEQCLHNERQAMDHVAQHNATLQSKALDLISSVTDSDDRFADKRFDAVCDTSNTHTLMIPRKVSRCVSLRKEARKSTTPC